MQTSKIKEIEYKSYIIYSDCNPFLYQIKNKVGPAPECLRDEFFTDPNLAMKAVDGFLREKHKKVTGNK